MQVRFLLAGPSSKPERSKAFRPFSLFTLKCLSGRATGSEKGCHVPGLYWGHIWGQSEKILGAYLAFAGQVCAGRTAGEESMRIGGVRKSNRPRPNITPAAVLETRTLPAPPRRIGRIGISNTLDPARHGRGTICSGLKCLDWVTGLGDSAVGL